MNRLKIAGFLLALLACIGCGNRLVSRDGASGGERSRQSIKEVDKKIMDQNNGFKQATFGSGCFWCTEAIFERLEGVTKVVSGYAGGHVENPTYEQVCTGTTGHAESVQITYDPAKVTYEALLEVFWKTHDPTTKDRQGNDHGPQYRSVIFFHDAEQKRLAASYRNMLEAEHIWNRPIVTEIVPFTTFWPAEDYHQNYYDNNPARGYCSFVITPKIEKFRKVFKDRLKKE